MGPLKLTLPRRPCLVLIIMNEPLFIIDNRQKPDSQNTFSGPRRDGERPHPTPGADARIHGGVRRKYGEGVASYWA